MKKQPRAPTGWPLYALLAAGIAFTGVFPWLMVGWALFRQGARRTAVVVTLLNTIVLCALYWFSLRVPVVWWKATISLHLFNLTWAAAAWIFQRKTLGPSARRYVTREWRTWLVPLFIGVVLGVSIASTFAIPTALGERMELYQAADTLARETLLWSFFRFSLVGLVAGLLVGLWWAGLGRKFSSSHVLTFLGAYGLTIVSWFFIVVLLYVLFEGGGGGEMDNVSSWTTLVPPWESGIQKFLMGLDNYDVSVLLVTPLLFGAVSRLRDFAKRSVIVPLSIVCAMPLSLVSPDWWMAVQDRSLHETTSAREKTRDAAHGWLNIVLARFPDHAEWPRIAEPQARHFYQRGQYGQARTLYENIAERTEGANRWYALGNRSRAIAGAPRFGEAPIGGSLAIPMVDYEKYLTQNWMSLLAYLRYWKGPEAPESDLKIELKEMSLRDDRIALNPIETLADLDDAVNNLGYEMLIFPADLERIKALIAAGIPALQPHYNSFNLLFGIDGNREVVKAYSFGNFSERLRNEMREEAREILNIEKEVGDESSQRLTRIAADTYTEYEMSFWKNSALRHVAPFAAVVFPLEKSDAVAAALGTPLVELRRNSDGLLAAFVGLSFLNHADPVSAIEWARRGSELTADPLPLYVAFLGERLWSARWHTIRSSIPLQNRFVELDRFFAYFRNDETRTFLRTARLRFETDLHDGVLPWFIPHKLLSYLDNSVAEDLELRRVVLRRLAAFNPAHADYWRSLADACELSNDAAGMIEALREAVSADPLDFETKLRLSYELVLLGRPAESRDVLSTIDTAEVVNDADLFFVQGAVAEWEGETKRAVKAYEKALDMRRYTPVYSLRYGELLLKEGRREEARKALQWALKTDAEGAVRKEAAGMLARLDGGT